ncbi:hypothetical protein KIW84_022845 [Lathyrus oleraceus]|uniref:Uncharacterized protein n=1 Tax=Pisum sativum TaxID=3888 RepID=A0A9D4YDG8_PEA|nr:hypothetical protein KIW84_022845 [Pisum sativum]
MTRHRVATKSYTTKLHSAENARKCQRQHQHCSSNTTCNQNQALGGLVGDHCGIVPTSAFYIDARHMQKVIQRNKDLGLPAHKNEKKLERYSEPHLGIIQARSSLCRVAHNVVDEPKVFVETAPDKPIGKALPSSHVKPGS